MEAGYRTRSLTNPEEVNRVCADHVSSLLFAVTQQCLANLREEGLEDRSQFVGDPMYDAFIRAREKACGMSHELVCFDGSVRDIPGDYYYLTCHREENTADDNALREVLAAMEELDAPTVYPVHPRNRERVLRLCGQRSYESVVFCDPVGYYTSIALVLGARKVVTDSGGLQREAFFAQKKCVTVLPFVVIPETMVSGRNTLRRRSGIPSRKLFPSSSISIPSISLLATGMRGIAWCPACLHSAARRTRAAVRRSAILFMAIDEAKAAFLCYPAFGRFEAWGLLRVLLVFG